MPCRPRQPPFLETSERNDRLGTSLGCVNRIPGDGLGLVRGLTQQLRGTFKVERAPEARCTVTFVENRTS
jgi:two-component sensor histidine kinase